MSGGMHVFDMIIRLRNNENLRRMNYFKTKGSFARHSNSINVDFRTATKAEREEIRKRVKDERIMEKWKSMLAFILSLLLTATIVFLLVRFLKP